MNLGEADFAVVPFENSTNGQVVFTYDLLRDWFAQRECALRIVGEEFVAINHCVLSNAVLLAQCHTIYLHPQVWGQVTKFARENLGSSISRSDTSSTSQAAALVHADTTNTTACILSRTSARLYNLPILYADVEDDHNNSTRFLVIGTETRAGPSADDDEYLTLVLFTLNHNDPGALCGALDVFSRHRVNLASITLRPLHLARWQYVFFAEMHGSLADANVAAGIAEMQEKCQVTVMGSFLRATQGQ